MPEPHVQESDSLLASAEGKAKGREGGCLWENERVALEPCKLSWCPRPWLHGTEKLSDMLRLLPVIMHQLFTHDCGNR